MTSVADPLGHSIRLDLRQRFPLLGVPVEVMTNSQEVLAMAAAAFAGWDGLDPALVRQQPPCQLRIAVHPSPAGRSQAPPTFRLNDQCLLAACPGLIFSADRRSGRGLAFAAPARLKHQQWFSRHVLDCMALFLATAEDRVPLHAAVVVKDRQALVLLGSSGAGKSTLTYALVREGHRLLAEEAVYLSLNGGLRLWGHPRRIMLRPSSKRFFPELAALKPVRQANGKIKLAVELPTSTGGASVERSFAGPLVLCFLERGDGEQPALAPLSASDALRQLGQPREQGFDIDAGFPQAARALTAYPAFLLRSGATPAASVDAINQRIFAR